MKVNSYNGNYGDRQGRYEFLVRNFGEYITGRILDVGCDNAYLRSALKGKAWYFGVDIAGQPDVLANLERGFLPFKSEHFDLVCCLDVLEHLNEPHIVFDELTRVAKRTILISLPNNLYLRQRIKVAWGMVPNRYYGLDYEPQKDRHKWLFTISQARDFVNRRCRERAFAVVKEFSYYKTDGRLGAVSKICRGWNLWPGLFAKSYWVLLQRK